MFQKILHEYGLMELKFSAIFEKHCKCDDGELDTVDIHTNVSI